VAAVAAELGELANRVVFIGGAIAPLLQTDPPFPRARPTSDVDGVIATSAYAEWQRFQVRLIQKGFRQDPGDPTHAHRWIGPSGIPFDLTPTGEHLGGSGRDWDASAIATAVEVTLAGGVRIRHASAPAFLAQKWAAHHDRGQDDPLASRDLEDLLALLASRPGIVDEVTAAPSQLRAYVADQAKGFLRGSDADDLLAAHLNNAQDPALTMHAVRTLLERLSTAATG
jgi:predicted nucleotidyltransferase